MNDTHGFITREGWKGLFDEYFEKIRSIDIMVNDFYGKHQDIEQWLKAYQIKSKQARDMYTSSNHALEYHFYYFINAAENWKQEKADALLSYLYRYCTRFEDVEVAFTAAQSLYG